jgi:starch synthase
MTALVPTYIKTTYKNDPTFKNAKVVYSVYENCFNEKLNAGFQKKAIMDNMSSSDIEAFGDLSCSNLHIGAIAQSDAVVFGAENVDDAVLKYVKDSNKPTLAFNLTDDFDNFQNFYEEIFNEELVTTI